MSCFVTVLAARPAGRPPEAIPTPTRSCSRTTWRGGGPARCVRVRLDTPRIRDRTEHLAALLVELGFVPPDPSDLHTGGVADTLRTPLGDAPIDQHNLEAFRRAPLPRLVEHRGGRIVVVDRGGQHDQVPFAVQRRNWDQMRVHGPKSDGSIRH